MKLTDVKFHYLKLVIAVNVALGLLFLGALGHFAGSIGSALHKQEKKARSSPAGVPRPQKKETIRDYEAMLQKNPFGISPGSLSQTVPGDRPDLSEFKLLGTISGRNKRGYAVFVGKDGKQSLFHTGESVFGAGRLTTVEPYQASLERDGKLIRIPMVDVVAPDAMEMSKGGGAVPGVSGVRALGKGEYVIDQKALRNALDNPLQIMTDAKLVPNLVKDMQEGFVLREVRKNGIYDSLGMQNGDILLRINGSGISNPETALQAFMALRGMDRIQLDIIRASAPRVLNY